MSGRRCPNESWVRLGQVDVISSERSVINIKFGPLLELRPEVET